MIMSISSKLDHAADQKRRELFFFSKFRALSSVCRGAQPTQPDPPEPDIIVGEIGVEITEFYSQDTRKRDETEQQLVLEEAQHIYEKAHTRDVIVAVNWNQSAAPSRKDRPTLAGQLVDVVIKNMPRVDAWIEIEQDGDPGCALPSIIDSIKIQRFAVHKSSYFFSPRSAFLFPCSIDQLQAVISGKDSKFTAYAGMCKSLFLLIVAEGRATSSWCQIPQEASDHQYKSIFDRVFFLNLISSGITELSVASNALPVTPME